MNILEQTFDDHEHLAPEAMDVLREIRRTIDGRHRARRRVGAVAGVGVSVAAVAVGAAVLNGSDSPPRPQRPAGSQTVHSPLRVTPAPAVERAVPVPDYTTISAGWLPSTHYTRSFVLNDGTSQIIEYDMRAGGQDVIALVEQNRGSAFDTQSKSGPGGYTDRTFAGHVAREWDSGGYSKLMIRRGGTVVSVETIVDGFKGSGALAINEHIARQLRYDVHDAFDPGFHLTWVPAGVTISGVHVEDFHADYRVAGARIGLPLVQVDQSGSSGTVGRPSGHPGRPVQGHATTVDTLGRTSVLTVPGLLPGHTVTFATSGGVTTLAQLYRIADGFRAGR